MERQPWRRGLRCATTRVIAARMVAGLRLPTQTRSADPLFTLTATCSWLTAFETLVLRACTGHVQCWCGCAADTLAVDGLTTGQCAKSARILSNHYATEATTGNGQRS